MLHAAPVAAGWEQQERRGRRGRPVDVDEVEEVRALLRSDDPSARRAALARVRDWDGTTLDDRAATAVLRTVTVPHRWVPGERVDPSELLARVLWAAPRAVPATHVEAAYHAAAERVRRSLLHLLALRRDAEGRVALEFLLGADGPVELLPAATSALLDPVLDLDDLGDLPRLLAAVAGRPGWAWHASDLLRRLVIDERLDDRTVDEVVDRLAPTVTELVDAVDRALPTRALDRGPGGDVTRDDRGRLTSILRLLEVVPTTRSNRLVHRALASADPRVAAVAALALVAWDAPVPPERLDLIARDAEARSLLLEGLEDLGSAERLPARHRTGLARAEADLVRWLATETELGTTPDEVEHLATLTLPPRGPRHPSRLTGNAGDEERVELFRFRLRAPHWSFARGWMVGAAGPYTVDGRRTGRPFAHSLYRADDEMTPAEHLAAIRRALVGQAPPT
jgi:hypothetical protein